MLFNAHFSHHLLLFCPFLLTTHPITTENKHKCELTLGSQRGIYQLL